MTTHQAEKVRSWIAIAGIILGCIAIAISLYTNKQSSDRNEAALSTFTAASCVRQHASAEQWDSVLVVLRDISEKNHPGASQTPGFQELERRTHAIYSVFPACVGFKYDPVTKTAVPLK